MLHYSLACIGGRVHGGHEPEARVPLQRLAVAALVQGDAAARALQQPRYALQRLQATHKTPETRRGIHHARVYLKPKRKQKHMTSLDATRNASESTAWQALSQLLLVGHQNLCTGYFGAVRVSLQCAGNMQHSGQAQQ